MYENDLYHHGIKGMKWGVRRYQNPDGTLTPAGRKREAKQYTKSLNDLDKESVKYIAKYMKKDAKTRRYANKGAKYIKKHDANTTEKDIKRLEKISSKMEAADKSAKEELAAFRNNDSATWKLIAEAAQKGYTVHSKEVTRNGEIGRTYIQGILGGTFGQITINSIRNSLYYNGRYNYTNKRGMVVDQAPWAIQGNKYKVKDTPDGDPYKVKNRYPSDNPKIQEINAKFSKKVNSAKTKEEQELAELEWDEAVEKAGYYD